MAGFESWTIVKVIFSCKSRSSSAADVTDRVLTDAPHGALERLIPALHHGVRPGARGEADEVRRPRV